MTKVRHGPARVTFSGDEEVAKTHLSVALHLLRKTEERARAGGLGVLADQQILDDDSFCYCIVAGSISAVHIVAGSRTSGGETVVSAFPPDFISGVVRNGYIYDIPASQTSPAKKVMQTIHPTDPTATAYGLPQSYQDMERMAVEPWTAFDMLRNQNPSGVPVYSQYTQLKPTMYSGRMRDVVQALMGFGRQRKQGDKTLSLYDTFLQKTMLDKGDAPPKPSRYDSDVAKNGLQIRYDWRFVRTHGIGVGSNGALWLVEISMNNGVLAMPLPLHAMTTTPKFRDYIQNRKLPSSRARERAMDNDALKLIDDFGGFPTGEAFPISAQIDAWVRAGRILRLRSRDDLHDFYTCSAYSSSMGWAFNRSGTEAHNTAWYLDDDGWPTGVHYAISMSFGAAKQVKPNGAAAGLKARFQTVASDKSLADIIDAAIWKLDRCSNDQLQAIQDAMRNGVADGVRYADSLELDPIATGTASLSLSGKGRLANPAKTGTLIKFPEPLIGLLVWFDMRKELGSPPPNTPPRCDTVMHVFFDGDQLKWVRYYSDDRPSIKPLHNDDFEDCMYVGRWTSHDDATYPVTGKMFYTTEFDDRGEFSETFTDVTIVGKDIGYYAVEVGDCLIYPPNAWLSRSKAFSVDTDLQTTNGYSRNSAVAVPFFDREAYYYALHESHSGKSHTVSRGYKYLGDPWSYVTFRLFAGWTNAKTPHPDGCSSPASHRRTIMSSQYMSGACGTPCGQHDSQASIYCPGECSDFADSGPWASLCQDADSMVYSIPQPPSFSNTTTEQPTGNTKVWLVTSSEPKVIQTIDRPDLYFGLWPLRSPFDGDYDGSADQWIGDMANAYGAANSLIYSTNLNEVSKVYGSPHYPEMDLGGVNYVGVING